MGTVPRTCEVVRTIGTHESAVRGVKMTPDGKKVVSASADGIVKVWDFETGTLLHVMDHGAPNHWDEGTGIIFSLDVTPDGRYAMTGGNDRSIVVWDINTGALVRRMKTPEEYVQFIHMMPGGKEILAGFAEGLLAIINFDTGAVKRKIGSFLDISHVALVPNSSLAVIVSNTVKEPGEWHLVDYLRSEILYTRHNFSEEDPTRREDIKAACVSPDGQFLVTSTIGYLKVWTLNQGELLDRMKVYRWFQVLRFLPNTNKLLVDYCRRLVSNLSKNDQNRMSLLNRFELITMPPYANDDVQQKTGDLSATSLTGQMNYILVGTDGYNGLVGLILCNEEEKGTKLPPMK